MNEKIYLNDLVYPKVDREDIVVGAVGTEVFYKCPDLKKKSDLGLYVALIVCVSFIPFIFV